MSTLLLKLHGDLTLNRTMFPPYLYVYDDLLIYKRRKLFVVKEITISYSQITQISVASGIFFATIELLTTGDEKICIKWVPKKLAKAAKKIIDQKIYHSHAKHQGEHKSHDDNDIKSYEKALNRLHELKERGHITEKELLSRKDALLKAIR